MSNKDLNNAKEKKQNEFYTQWGVIEKEVQMYLDYNPNVFKDKTILCPCDDPEWSNFTKFFAFHFEDYGLKKLISTSYASYSKTYDDGYQVSLFEKEDPKFDESKTYNHGKLFILTRNDKKVNIENLQWQYLEGDGDFRSDEVKKLRAEADLIITNPPFSLIREFIKWIFEVNKDFLIIGSITDVTCKEVFPLVKHNKMWYGPSISSGDRPFYVPENMPLKAAGCGYDETGKPYIRVKGVRWLTNLDHGRRHQPISFMTTEENLKFSKHNCLRGKAAYTRYDNLDVIDVPYSDALPSDYKGVMAVPITFLDKYCPEQIEIVGIPGDGENKDLFIEGFKKYDRGYINGARKFPKLLVKFRNNEGE